MTPDQDSVAPTLAVGLGNAGCSMISALRDMTIDEGIEDKFRFFGVDTNNEDLRSNIDYESPDVTKHNLKSPEQWDEHSSDYHYLDPSLLRTEGDIQDSGALRKRRIGRYYVDSYTNFNRLRKRLTSVIEQFGKEFEENIDKKNGKMHIWIINSLGGGTGSGSFPIIAALIRHITRRTERATHDYKLYGLGALPNTNNVTQEYHDYYLNSYAALRDIQVLTGNDQKSESEIRLGEERKSLPLDDRFDLPNITFDAYFLQPFNQNKMSSSAYRYQLNRASATVPLYFSLVKGKEDWPDQHAEMVNPGIYAFDTYELAVPVEDIYRYFDTSERINELENRLSNLRTKKERVTADIVHIDDVFDFDVEDLIVQYKEDRDDDDEVRMTEVIPEEVALPDNVAYDMVATAKSAVGGLSLTIPNIDETVKRRYDTDWDDTSTEVLNHRDIFEYVFYQLAERKAKEEKWNHEFNDLIESKWNKYRDELMDEFAFLDASDAKSKWQDGLSKFYEEKIDARERSLPTGALFGAGFVLLLAILLLSSLLLNVSQVQTLAETSVPLASVPISIASTLVGILLLITLGMAAVYLVPYLQLSSLKNERDECEEMFGRYTALEKVENEMEARRDRIDLNRTQLQERKSELAASIERNEKLLENQKSVRDEVINRLDSFRFEFERRAAFPIREPDNLAQPGTKKKTWEYVHNKRSLGTDVVNREIFDGDIQMDTQYDSIEVTEEVPDSISWFVSRGHISETDVNRAFNDILAMDEGISPRLAECPLINRTNKDPSQDRKILQFVWNSINSQIKNATNGGQSYETLESAYDRQNDVETSDELRVWMMGVYTNLQFENMAVYDDINREYAESEGEGDLNVVDELDIPEGAYGASSFMTKRVAYPEFYQRYNHPITEEVESYPE